MTPTIPNHFPHYALGCAPFELWYGHRPNPANQHAWPMSTYRTTRGRCPSMEYTQGSVHSLRIVTTTRVGSPWTKRLVIGSFQDGPAAPQDSLAAPRPPADPPCHRSPIRMSCVGGDTPSACISTPGCHRTYLRLAQRSYRLHLLNSRIALDFLPHLHHSAPPQTV